ncbi:MAG: glutaredoxin [Faecalicoccus sp.]|nr:glutaredoxin [Faecalicoccus sp.]
MLKIYGSDLCPDCLACKKDLDARGVEYTYLNITESLKLMKEFLALRDSNPVFDSVRKKGNIGIPALVCQDGKVLLDWNELDQ